MSFAPPKFTNQGKQAFLRALDGDPLTFTSIKMGDGVLSGQLISQLEDLIHPTATLDINRIIVSEDGYASVTGVFNNQSLAEGFYWREIGLFCQDPDDPGKEILYCYQNSGEKANYIEHPGSEIIEKVVKIIAVVDDAENVSAVINESAVYATTQEVLLMMKEHATGTHAHDSLFADYYFYVDSSVSETATMDGTKEHPFSTVQRAIGKIPPGAKSGKIVLRTGRTYDGMYLDKLYGLNIGIYHLNGDDGHIPTVPYIRAENCHNLTVSDLNISTGSTDSQFVGCSNLELNRCYFKNTAMSQCVLFKRTNAVIHQCDFTGYTEYAIDCQGTLMVLISDCTIHSSKTGVSVTNSGTAVMRYCICTDVQKEMHVLPDSFGISNTASIELSNDNYHWHITNPHNPHNTTLAQILEVTDQDVVRVEQGGTGRGDRGLRLESDITNDVKHGSIILGDMLVIMWGKIRTEGASSVSVDFEELCGAKFTNERYVLVLSGQDSGWGSPEKRQTGFTVPGVVGSRLVADWIAIGTGNQTATWGGLEY